MYLEPANNNKASTGFTFFLTSCERNGLPSRYVQEAVQSDMHHMHVIRTVIIYLYNFFTYTLYRRVRCDRGVENVVIARFMFTVRGTDGQVLFQEKVSTTRESNGFGVMCGLP
ncbi:Prolactin [Dissostichus eleginoides]|uniref:Prolactin n=1 Tax=Dissostichus eleginoides TaxID=100907 RepID=A0AAD9C6R5_DISEL|nr:Prolactin [Dissostichus eleginoides]